MLFASKPPHRVPVNPFQIGSSSLFRSYNPFLLSGCNPFFGFGFGCGAFGGYGLAYFPSLGYPSGAPDYPSPPDSPTEPTYPSGPAYNPPDPSATLQYTPLFNQDSSLLTSSADPAAYANGRGQLRNEVVLYLKDGSVFSVASYMVSNGVLHYVTAYGHKNDMPVAVLDLQKTIRANADRGVAFTLTPDTDPSGAQPTPLGPAPAPPGPITPPKQ